MPLQISDLSLRYYLYPADNGFTYRVRCRVAIQDALMALQPALALQPMFGPTDGKPSGLSTRKLMLEAVEPDGIGSRVFHKFVPFRYDPSVNPLGTIILVDGLGYTIIACLSEQRWHGYGL